MRALGGFTPNFSDPNYVYYNPFNVWSYNDGISMIEAVRLCLVIGLKLGTYNGLNFEKKRHDFC